jgi:hypothetical protein
MSSSKIEQLLEFLKEDPKDSFTLYALALEYEKTDGNKAKEYYDLLLNEHSDYLATYYHAAKWYEKLDKEASKNIYRKGMELAQKQGKVKPYNELQNALNVLLDEDLE